MPARQLDTQQKTDTKTDMGGNYKKKNTQIILKNLKVMGQS